MSPRSVPLLALGVTVVIWSMTYVASSWALETGSAAVLSVGRFGLALVVLVPLAMRRPGFARLLREPRSILLGLTGITLYYALANIGLEFTSPGTAALVASFMPVTTAVVAVLLIRERIAPRTAIGLVVATIGVAVVSAAGFELDVGVVLNLLGIVSYAFYTVLLRRDTGRGRADDAIALAAASAVWGTLLLLPWLGSEIVTGTAAIPSDPRGMLSIVGLALLGTAPPLVLFSFSAQRLPAAVTGVATAAVPALGYAYAVLLGEPLDLVKTLGGAVALAGVLIATLSQPRVAPSPAGSAVPDPVIREEDPENLDPDVDFARRRSTP